MIGTYICAAMTVIFAIFFIVSRVKKNVMFSLVFKTLSGIGFTFTAVYASLANNLNPVYSALVISGAVFGLVGDVFMQLKYFDAGNFKKFMMFGMGFFTLGHFFYFSALCVSSTISIYPFIGAAIMAVVCYIGLSTKRFEKVGRIKPYSCGYYFVLSVTLFQAIFAFVYADNMQTLLFLIGACLFFISDTLLACIYFARFERRRYTVINLTTYYLAQLAIALSILFLA